MKVQVKSLQPNRQEKINIMLNQHIKLLTVAFIFLVIVAVVLVIGVLTAGVLLGGVK